MAQNDPLVIAIVAGEASGDTLGADLVSALKQQFPNAIFEGIGGPKMASQGHNSLFSMDRLSVMGFIDPLKRLPELLSIRRFIVNRYLKTPPAVFIGIDSPDFNLGIEQRLHSKGIKTMHYVSPSVWAWRTGRIKKIKRSVDLMLTLFPFEASFYQDHDVAVCYVGHPLAKQFAQQPETAVARLDLGLDPQKPVLCIMPGSRSGEVEMLAELFLDAAAQVADQIDSGLQIVIPAANSARYEQLSKILASRSKDIILLNQQSHRAMEAADVVLLASGTTALEAMLLKKPMVVSYRLGALTYRLVSPLIKTKYVSIPNLLAGKMLVPELIQEDANIENITAHIMAAFDQHTAKSLTANFADLHQQLAIDSGSVAAAAIADLLAGN
jgi:lipid-A-disaccharide synthase